MQKLKNVFWFVFSYFLVVQQVWADAATETTANVANDGFAIIPVKLIEGCDFQEGKMKLSCIPHYISYLIEIIISLAGTIAVIFVMIGGFKYVFSGISDDKEAGKETIKHALIGLAVAGLAWVIVTWVVALVTM